MRKIFFAAFASLAFFGASIAAIGPASFGNLFRVVDVNEGVAVMYGDLPAFTPVSAATYSGIELNGSGGGYVIMRTNNTARAQMYSDSGGAKFGTRDGTRVDFTVNNSSQLTIASNGQVGIAASNGATPTIGACGTSPSLSGKDNAFLFTVGTGGVAVSCAATFGGTWGVAPICSAHSTVTADAALAVATTTTTITVTKAAALTASSNIHVICFGRS